MNHLIALLFLLFVFIIAGGLIYAHFNSEKKQVAQITFRDFESEAAKATKLEEKLNQVFKESAMRMDAIEQRKKEHYEQTGETLDLNGDIHEVYFAENLKLVEIEAAYLSGRL